MRNFVTVGYAMARRALGPSYPIHSFTDIYGALDNEGRPLPTGTKSYADAPSFNRGRLHVSLAEGPTGYRSEAMTAPTQKIGLQFS